MCYSSQKGWKPPSCSHFRFDDYISLAACLHCLGPGNVPHFWDESRFLDAVGRRMGQLLTGMTYAEAQRAVATSLCRDSTLAQVLNFDALSTEE